jgi:hypothetical protein
MGRRDDVSVLIERAQLDDYFAGLVSLEDVKCYKPSPIAYAHFLETTGTAPADAWLVSGNPFDVLGAVSAGICGAWVKRSPDADPRSMGDRADGDRRGSAGTLRHPGRPSFVTRAIAQNTAWWVRRGVSRLARSVQNTAWRLRRGVSRLARASVPPIVSAGAWYGSRWVVDPTTTGSRAARAAPTATQAPAPSDSRRAGLCRL